GGRAAVAVPLAHRGVGPSGAPRWCARLPELHGVQAGAVARGAQPVRRVRARSHDADRGTRHVPAAAARAPVGGGLPAERARATAPARVRRPARSGPARTRLETPGTA